MPITISNSTGDGITSNRIDTDIELPDTGTGVSIVGTVMPAGGVTVNLTGSPIAAPAAPATGLVYWAIEANLTTGALAVIQSTTGTPTVDAGCIILFLQTLAPGQTSDTLAGADSTPDTA